MPLNSFLCGQCLSKLALLFVFHLHFPAALFQGFTKWDLLDIIRQRLRHKATHGDFASFQQRKIDWLSMKMRWWWRSFLLRVRSSFDNVILEVSQDTIVLMSQKTFGRCGLEPRNKTSSFSFCCFYLPWALFHKVEWCSFWNRHSYVYVFHKKTCNWCIGLYKNPFLKSSWCY